MSALAALAQYASDSEDAAELGSPPPRARSAHKLKLPTPKLSSIHVTEQEHVEDNPEEHGGRVRSFPHVRGNWATFLYVQCPVNDFFSRFTQKIKQHSALLAQCEPCGDLHISLSRTIVLRYHWINTFTSTLQDLLRNVECDPLEFNAVKVYCNEEETRTFIALQVDQSGSKQLAKITEKINCALDEFKLPKYYEVPSFHVSVLWCPGNKLEDLNNICEELQQILYKCKKEQVYVAVDKIVCKCGNRFYQFPLKD